MNDKILLVDDEKGIVALMKNYFDMAGYQVYTAYDGEEALEKVSCKPDIILLDINMSGLDGISVCERIRRHISCPILFLRVCYIRNTVKNLSPHGIRKYKK